MSDLISRSELIKELNKYCGSQRYLVSENIREIINNQPTAYDVDKVTEELRERSREYNSGVRLHGKPEEMITDEVIEIVKQGGIEKNVSE